MGNELKTVKIANNQILNSNLPLKEQLVRMNTETLPYIGLIQKYRLSHQNVKNPTIYAKIHVNTISDNEAPVFKEHELRKLLKHEHLIEYYGMSYEDKLLVNNFETEWFFESLHYTLQKIIDENARNRTQMNEEHLWKLLKQLASVLYYLEEKNLFHTYIQPDQIYFDYQGTLKVIEKGLLRQVSGYAATVLSEDKDEIIGNQAFLSPKLIEELKQKQKQPIHDIAKSDVYALGMTFLEMMTLKSSFQLYNFGNNPKIYQEKIEERLVESQRIGYSSDLIQIVKWMLEQDEDSRISFKQILELRELNKHLDISLEQHTERRSPMKAVKQEVEIYVEQPQQEQQQQEQQQQQQIVYIQQMPQIVKQQIITQAQQNQQQYPQQQQFIRYNNIQQEQQQKQQQQQQQLLQQQLLQQQQQQQYIQQQQYLQQQQKQHYLQQSPQQARIISQQMIQSPQLQQQQFIQSPQRQVYQQKSPIASQVVPQQIQFSPTPKQSQLFAATNQHTPIQNITQQPPTIVASSPNYEEMNKKFKAEVLDDSKESWQINQRVNHALALSRQAVEKYGQY